MDQVNGSEFTAAGAQLPSLKLVAELLCIEKEGSPFSYRYPVVMKLLWCRPAVLSCELLVAPGSPCTSRANVGAVGRVRKGQGFLLNVL